MTSLVLIVLVSLGAIFLWGLLAPRSQWRVLVSWSYRDPHTDEPSGSAYLLYRVVAALGIATMVTSGILTYQDHLNNLPKPPAPPTAVQVMWGTTPPVVVNRVITSVGTAPKNLVDQPILGYQAVDGQTRQPPYLFKLAPFVLDTATTENGYIGKDPDPGLTALDTAELVVQVKGDPRCFPHAAIVRETDETVSVAIFYGQSNPTDGAHTENLADCNVLASGANVSTLIPIPLASPLKDRTVLTLEGDAIREVPLVQ
ncbi:MAG TPA: hypothetical protein PKI99_02035 [Terrimesophilobacter sp.]|nr:hypothetical protein [Terrimesophilobacter sp.]